MKSFKLITDPEAFQLLADETRRRIVYLLRAKERTVSQIAEELSLTPQAIYHHIRKLRDAGMVEVGREERVDHFIETYYRATAEMFHLSHGEGGSSKLYEEETREALEAMSKLGVKVNTDPALVTKVVDLVKGMKDAYQDSPWTDRVNELEGVDFLVKQTLLEYVNLCTMSDAEFEDHLKKYRGLRKALKSSVLEPIPVSKKA
jgi:DNA-binding transcriptional ArsR family regulator